MKYARAAWRIFVARVARWLHLPQRIVSDLEDRAGIAMFDCARDFERKPRRPAGWACDHMAMTAGAGLMSSPPSSWCGCDMQPVYAP